MKNLLKNPKNMLIILILFFILYLVPAIHLLAITVRGPDRIILDIWYNLEPMVSLQGEQYPIPQQKAVKALLKEARVIISGMIYGYRFIYTPADRARKIKEFFQITPIAQIKWGDKNLSVLSTRTENKRLYVKLSYRLMEFQKLRLKAWSSSRIPTSTGEGKASIFKGQSQRMVSLKSAMKNAIRNYLRPRIFNKPREIRGELLIWDSPYLAVNNAMYITTLRVKLIVKEILPYRIF